MEAQGKRFLIYGYFSSATPSSMARVFQAYACRYAMLLDMNALEHTYLAVYHLQDSLLQTQHLIDGMSVVDRSKAGLYLPRFVGRRRALLARKPGDGPEEPRELPPGLPLLQDDPRP